MKVRVSVAMAQRKAALVDKAFRHLWVINKKSQR
jgi:ribosomal protein L36